jgi:Rrf2 family protein
MQNSCFSISIHILTLLAKAERGLLSSEFMAESININPVLVRKELINLRKHKLVESKEGKNGGVYLSRSPGNIYLSEIYMAVMPSALLGKSKNKPNPNCNVGKQINTHLDSLFSDAENALIRQLEKVTLKKFVQKFV